MLKPEMIKKLPIFVYSRSKVRNRLRYLSQMRLIIMNCMEKYVNNFKKIRSQANQSSLFCRGIVPTPIA